MSWIKVILDERMAKLIDITEAIFATENSEIIEEWLSSGGLHIEHSHDELLDICTEDNFDEVCIVGETLLNKVKNNFCKQ